jgi:hypothetical protein
VLVFFKTLGLLWVELIQVAWQGKISHDGGSFLKMFWLKKIIISSRGADSRVMIKDGSIL